MTARELADHALSEIEILAPASVTSSDYTLIHDVSEDKTKRVLTTLFPTGVTATAAEINVLHGVTAGTSKSSKAVVLSAAGKIDTLDITTPKWNGVTVKSATTVAADSTTAATTLTTALALANALQAKLNDVIAKLKTAGIVKST